MNASQSLTTEMNNDTLEKWWLAPFPLMLSIFKANVEINN